jgi:hypothetical protein
MVAAMHNVAYHGEAREVLMFRKRVVMAAIALAACVCAAGVVAAVSAGSANALQKTASSACPRPPKWQEGCLVQLTATGPSPSTMVIPAATDLFFANPDSVSHTVVFANSGCSLTLAPGQGFSEFGDRASPDWSCNDRPSYYVGNSTYTMDGKFAGTVETTPLRRSVSLTARTHSVRGGTRLILHGQVNPPGWRHHVSNPSGWRTYTSVVVLARQNGKHLFRPIATINPGLMAKVPGNWRQRWSLTVQPDVTTTYIAKVTGQLPEGQIWIDAKSRPFTVRIRKGS